MNTVNYTIIPTLTQYSEPERDAELELKWNQVKTAVDNGSWNAMYAKDGAEFDSIVAKMKTDLDAYGYQDAWIGAANRPRSSSPCSKQPPLPCRRLTQRRSRAAFTVTLKMAKDREKSSVTRAFWTAYVQNLKHGVPLSPILLAGIYATWRRCFDKLEGYALSRRWPTARTCSAFSAGGPRTPGRRCSATACRITATRLTAGWKSCPVWGISRYTSRAAMLHSADQEFALKNQEQSRGFSCWAQLQLFHDACMNLRAGLDVIEEHSPLDGCQVVIVPTHFITDPAVVERLEARSTTYRPSR